MFGRTLFLAVNIKSKHLTLKDPCISGSSIEIKIKLNFYFHISLRCLKAFIKPFEAPQNSVKIKI